MVQPSKFKQLEFEWNDGNINEISNHRIEPYEAEECFYNRHQTFRNKKVRGRSYETFKLYGKTDQGRNLLLIFYVKEKITTRSQMGSTAIIRVITGWEV